MSAQILQAITDTDRRGAQVFAMDLQGALIDQGWSVTTRALAPGHSATTLDVSVLGSSRLAPVTLRALRRAIRAAGVVVGHGSTTLPACGVAGVGTATPFVYRSIGDLPHWTNTAERRLRVRLLLRRAEAVVALWPAAAEVLASSFGVPENRIHVIPTGAPAARFSPATHEERTAARRTFGLHPELPTVLYLGALSREKNVAAVLEAIARSEGCQLLVVGDGPQRAEIEALAERMAGERTRIAGATDDPTPAYAAADVVVLPSLSEGLPAVLIEAGLCGLPAVATDVGGVREIVVPGVSGELVPLDTGSLIDALQAVLAGPEDYGQRARRRCLERFEIGVVARAWARLLDTLH
jgi:glycosyltransferase involved in cell wall biosynthesis